MKKLRASHGSAATAVLLAALFVLPFGSGCASRASADKAAVTASAPQSAHAAPAAAPSATGPVIIHYHRFDGDYTDAGLWTWDNRKQREPGPEAAEVFATGKDDFGVIFTVDPSAYGNDDSAADSIGFIARLRKDWNRKDGTDRFWTPALGREVWLIGNDPTIYRERPDISPKVAFAFVDGIRRLKLNLSHPIDPALVTAAKVTVKGPGGAVPVKSATPQGLEGGKARFVDVELGQDFPLGSTEVSVAIEGYRAAPAKLRLVLDDADRFSSKEQMGASYTPGATTFRVFSPIAESVAVVLYDEATGQKGRREVAMTRGSNGVWETKVTGDLEGRFYRLKVKTQKYGEHEVLDPEATNNTGFDGHSRITDLRRQDPPGFRPVKRPDYGSSPTDAVIYQLHLRDFTIQPSSGVSAAHRGKFLGMTETGTHLPGDAQIRTVVEHLRELGVTHVQLQPMQDFDNDESKDEYNWGYMTSFFESPEGWFSTNHRDASRVREFKALVKALHDANIGVIMDVVYNHTGTQSSFEHVAPGYYLRMRDDGSFWNGSGTGNEFRSEAPMGRHFIVESLKFWVEEYGVDGFRFDLMGLIDLETMKQVRAELKAIYPEILVYGEPWAATGPDGTGAKRLLYKDVVRGTGLGAFNDHFRDAIKGSPDGADPGYIVDGKSRRNELKTGLAGAIDDWAANPTETINYTDVHDNLILWDKIARSAPNASEADRRQMQKLAGGILGVAQGVMLIHTGADFLRSKDSDHNSYRNGAVNEVDWNLKKANNDVFQFYRGIIAIRRAHPVFRLSTATEVRKRIRFHEETRPAPETIMFTLDGNGVPGETWKDVVVLINPTPVQQTFTLPITGELSIFALGDSTGTTSLGKANGTQLVPARSMAILAR